MGGGGRRLLKYHLIMSHLPPAKCRSIALLGQLGEEPPPGYRGDYINHKIDAARSFPSPSRNVFRDDGGRQLAAGSGGAENATKRHTQSKAAPRLITYGRFEWRGLLSRSLLLFGRAAHSTSRGEIRELADAHSAP